MPIRYALIHITAVPLRIFPEGTGPHVSFLCTMAENKTRTGPDKALVPQFTTPDGKPFEVPAEGSLSLLAMGHVGLMAWREARIRKAAAENLKGKKG